MSAHLRDETTVRGALSRIGGITHIAYAAIMEMPDDLVGGWSDLEQIAANHAMLRKGVETFIAQKSQLKHVSFLQGTKAHGGRVRPMPIPGARERPARPSRQLLS